MGIVMTSGGVSKTYSYYPSDALYVDANGNLNTSGNGRQVKEVWVNGVKYYPVTHPVYASADALEIISCIDIVTQSPKSCSIDCIPYKFTDDGMTIIYLQDGMTTPVLHQDYDSSAGAIVVARSEYFGECTYDVGLVRFSPGVYDASDLEYIELHKDEYAYLSNTNTKIPTVEDVGYFPSASSVIANSSDYLCYYCLNPFSTATVCILNLEETLSSGRTSRHVNTILKIPDWQAFRSEWRSRINEWPSEYRDLNQACMTYYADDINQRRIAIRKLQMDFVDDRQAAQDFENWGGIVPHETSFSFYIGYNMLYIDGVYYMLLQNSYDIFSYKRYTNMPLAQYTRGSDSSSYTDPQRLAVLLSSMLGRRANYVMTRARIAWSLGAIGPAYGYGTFT